MNDCTVSLDEGFSLGSIVELRPGAERIRIKSLGANGLPDLMEVWDGERYVERVPQLEILGVINGPLCLKFGADVSVEFCP